MTHHAPDNETPIDHSSNAIVDGDDSVVRVGSPFAVDPPELAFQYASFPTDRGGFDDAGPLRYTAMGAAAASAMVVVFAAASLAWFPAGGVLIALLGCSLAIFGLFSSYRFAAMALLVVHLGLFVANYSQTLQ